MRRSIRGILAPSGEGGRVQREVQGGPVSEVRSLREKQHLQVRNRASERTSKIQASLKKKKATKTGSKTKYLPGLLTGFIIPR